VSRRCWFPEDQETSRASEFRSSVRQFLIDEQVLVAVQNWTRDANGVWPKRSSREMKDAVAVPTVG